MSYYVETMKMIAKRIDDFLQKRQGKKKEREEEKDENSKVNREEKDERENK